MRFTRQGLDCRVSALQFILLFHRAGHRSDSSRQGKTNRGLNEQRDLLRCEIVF